MKKRIKSPLKPVTCSNVRVIGVRVNPNAHARLTEWADSQNMSLQQLLIAALDFADLQPESFEEYLVSHSMYGVARGVEQ